jgi:phosphatidylglycerophosphate synthase
MHELHKRAEWYPVPEAKRTGVQRLAARTQGVITPANGISLVGAVITIIGLTLFYQQRYSIGLLLVGVGRICDILDGQIARKTHTSSPFGEGLDAGFDKLVVLIACILLVASHVLPWELAVVLLILQSVIAGLALVVRHDGTGIHPTRVGKYAMFGLWMAIGLFMLAHVLAAGLPAQTAFVAAVTLMTATIIGNLVALRGYIKAVRRMP